MKKYLPALITVAVLAIIVEALGDLAQSETAGRPGLTQARADALDDRFDGVGTRHLADFGAVGIDLPVRLGRRGVHGSRL